MSKVIYIPWEYTDSEAEEYSGWIRTKFRRKYAHIQFQKETEKIFYKRTYNAVRCYVFTGFGHYGYECPNLKLESTHHVDLFIANKTVALIFEENSNSEELNCELHYVEEDACEIICAPAPMEVFFEDVIEENLVEIFEGPIVEIFEEPFVEEEIDLEGIQVLFEESIEDKESSIEIDAIKFFENVEVIESTGLIDQYFKELQSPHTYIDPFSVNYSPLDSVVADFLKLKITMFARMMAPLFIHFLVLDDGFYVGIIRCVWPTCIFDPGGFEDESFRIGRE